MKNLPRLLCLVLVMGFSLGMDCQGGGAGSLLPQLTLNLTIEGQGRVEMVGSDGNTDFTSDVFGEGVAVSLIAKPANGWVFMGWSGDVSSSESNIVIVMDSDNNVTAKFVALAGVRTITVDGTTGKMTIAVDGDQIRGNRRSDSFFGFDIDGNIEGKQIRLTSSSPGFTDSTITATLQSDGSLIGTIDGSGFSNDPFVGDPVSTPWTDHELAGQRTTTSNNNVDGVLTAIVSGNTIHGTWRLGNNTTGDIDGTITDNSLSFVLKVPGLESLSVTARVQTDGSWIGSIDGPGFSNSPFSAQPSFFP